MNSSRSCELCTLRGSRLCGERLSTKIPRWPQWPQWWNTPMWHTTPFHLTLSTWHTRV